MAIRYERDDTRRLIVATAEGPYKTSEFVEVIQRQRADDAWSYGLLYDLRRTTGHPAVADLRELTGSVASSGATETRRGPVAVLTSDPDLYRRACAVPRPCHRP